MDKKTNIVDPDLDSDQYFVYDLVSHKLTLGKFYDKFRKLRRCPPIVGRRILKRHELINVDVLYRDFRARFKIRADNLYLVAFCLALIQGNSHQTCVYELKLEGETGYIEGSEALKVDFRYTGFETGENARKFGYSTVRDSLIALTELPKTGAVGTYFKDHLVNFMLLIPEGGRNKLVGDSFVRLFRGYDLVKLDEKYIKLITNWDRYSGYAREARAGSTLGDAYKLPIEKFDVWAFEDVDTRGVAAEEFLMMKNLKNIDFERGYCLFKRNPGVEPDDHEGPRGHNPARRGPGPNPVARGSGHNPGRNGSAQKSVGCGGSGQTSKGRKRAWMEVEELGRYFHKNMYPGTGLLPLHSTYPHERYICSSGEVRVQMSAAAFAKGLLDLKGQLRPLQVSLVSEDSSMLDRLDNASIEMEKANEGRLNDLITVGMKAVQANVSSKRPRMAEGSALQPNALKLLPTLVKLTKDVIEQVSLAKDGDEKLTETTSYDVKSPYQQSSALDKTNKDVDRIAAGLPCGSEGYLPKYNDGVFLLY